MRMGRGGGEGGEVWLVVDVEAEAEGGVDIDSFEIA
jgi:hypothetical protein